MDESPTRYEITKYPNRRFYDVTRSRHVTLADMHGLVVAGHEIVVTDKATGRDITNVVLTQIILEHDPPKMELFPSSLLHQAIQMNQTAMRGFIDQYFARAMDAFSHSRRQFEAFLSRSGYRATPPTAVLDWLRMFMPGFSPQRDAPETPGNASTQTQDASDFPPEPDTTRDVPAADASTAQREDDLSALRRQMAAMSEQLEILKSNAESATAKRRAKKPRKAPPRRRS